MLRHNRSYSDNLKSSPPPPPLLSQAELSRVFEAERARTERTGSVFSVVVFEMPKGGHPISSKAIEIIEATARIYDALGQIDRHTTGVILPECEPKDATKFADRVIVKFGKENLHAVVRIFSYPVDWLEYIEDEDDDDSSGKGTFLPKGRKPNLKRPTGSTPKLRSSDQDEGPPLRTLMEEPPCEDLEPYFVIPLPKWRRALDIAVSAPLLAVLSVTLLPIVALLIKQDSPGGVFFKQTRVGQGGRHFTFFELRTMCVDAEARQHEIEHLNKQSEVIFKMPDRLHPFVTGVGKWLRTLSIDELPQLWNVLRGDMSLIGPRPPLPAEVANYKPWQRRRLDFVGGLTCEWQVRGFGKVAFTKGVRLDLDYIRNRNWRVDLMILLRTPAAALNNGIPH